MSNAPINSKVQHPPPGTPPGIWTFEDWVVQIPSPWGKKAVQMPHQLVLNYLSSKTNFVFNQTLYTPFWEINAVMTPSNFFYRPFILIELFTDKGEILTCKSIKPCKNRKKTHVRITFTLPTQCSNFPPPRARSTIKCPGYARGGGMLKFRIDRRITCTSKYDSLKRYMWGYLVLREFDRMWI